MRRTTISKKVRFEVFKRDSFTCQYCGKSAPDVVLNADHIIAVANGGTNVITNLITACLACNQGKGARELDDQSVAAKQMRQLKELNERREQVKMIAQWHKSLVSVEDEQVNAIEERINELTGRTLSPFGKKNMRSTIKKYGLAAVLEATEASALQYLRDPSRHEDIEKFINYIPRICYWQLEKKNNPEGAKIGYICAIASQKRFKCHRSEVWRLVTEANTKHGVPLDDILSLVRECTGILQFSQGLNGMIVETNHG